MAVEDTSGARHGLIHQVVDSRGEHGGLAEYLQEMPCASMVYIVSQFESLSQPLQPAV